MQKNLQANNLFNVFFTLHTRKESKIFLEKRTFEEESDSQLICSFISKHCNPDASYKLIKSFEFQDGFFIPHFELIEVDKSMFDLIKEENDAES